MNEHIEFVDRHFQYMIKGLLTGEEYDKIRFAKFKIGQRVRVVGDIAEVELNDPEVYLDRHMRRMGGQEHIIERIQRGNNGTLYTLIDEMYVWEESWLEEVSET